MIYSCDLPSGQTLYLENQDDITNATVLMKQAGQQQQSGSSVTTGIWRSLPEVFATSGGAVVRLTTAAGVWSLMVQGMSLSVQSGGIKMGGQMMPLTELSKMPNAESRSFFTSPMQPMTPMQPMAPMTPMAPMQPMGMSPMQMQMGNMGMSMGRSDSSVSSGSFSGNAEASPSRDTPVNASNNVSSSAGSVKFCSQCGTAVKVGDRFCSSCGHSLC